VTGGWSSPSMRVSMALEYSVTTPREGIASFATAAVV
jgi:hypothetical protein